VLNREVMGGKTGLEVWGYNLEGGGGGEGGTPDTSAPIKKPVKGGRWQYIIYKEGRASKFQYS